MRQEFSNPTKSARTLSAPGHLLDDLSGGHGSSKFVQVDTDHLWGAHPGRLHIWSRKEEIRVNNKVPLSTAALREIRGLPVVLRFSV